MLAQEARATGQVEEKVLSAVDHFYACRHCAKVYWIGPKFEQARTRFSELFVESARRRA